MKVELFPFQERALSDIRMKTAEAMRSYHRTYTSQVVSFTAPTGTGKTIIMAALIESILFGDENYTDQQNAIIVWLSDSPQLNEQSKLKIDGKADKIRLSQCITISEDSFDQEMFEDGHIYFLNTQKLSKTSNLTKNGDSRTYTIWETLANTVQEKSDRLYFIIDEAHRGMHGREAGRVTTIMQKFLKGSNEDGIPAMPVIIGMSATMQRFNKLVEGTSSTIHKTIVTAEAVRASGLLKDRIIITYPEDDTVNKDMAILQAAADDWKEKCGHWIQYCREQHYAYVNPVFIIQVLNGRGNKLTDTDLSDCLRKIEERIGVKFVDGQVVHTFGQTTSAIEVNGLHIRYEEPSRISDDKNIRVVFFKENLTTGWDCPRAETMMSFKHANDATYIAQLLGRMVRTPMQMHIQVDDVLNDVHLYLPYFSKDTVKKIVEELQNSEGGEITTDIYGESINNRTFVTLTVKKSHKKSVDDFGEGSLFVDDNVDTEDVGSGEQKESKANDSTDSISFLQAGPASTIGGAENQEKNRAERRESTVPETSSSSYPESDAHNQQTEAMMGKAAAPETSEDLFDREAIMKFINKSGLLSYHVRAVRTNDYLQSLFKMGHFLTMNAFHRESIREIQTEIAQLIHDYVEGLKKCGRYDGLVQKVKQFKLSIQIFDAFGQTIDNYAVHDLFTTTDSDIDRQIQLAERKLGGEGVGKFYVNKFAEGTDYSVKVDVILFAANDECMNQLHSYAKDRFHELDDKYRRKIAVKDSDKIQRQYDAIVSCGDAVSKHNFRLPESIQVPNESGGREYKHHLFVNQNTGTAKIKLNTWERAVIEEEECREDFVCWIRNPSRGSWALCISYQLNGETKPTYPDFIVVRKDEETEYVMDLLEPHDPTRDDNIGKAKGFAEYARENPGIGRIQLIRMSKDAAGNERFRRLDMAKSAVRDKILQAMTPEELNHIFDTDGFFDSNGKNLI